MGSGGREFKSHHLDYKYKYKFTGRQALKVTKTIGALVVEHSEDQLRYKGCVTPRGMRVIETARSVNL